MARVVGLSRYDFKFAVLRVKPQIPLPYTILEPLFSLLATWGARRSLLEDCARPVRSQPRKVAALREQPETSRLLLQN